MKKIIWENEREMGEFIRSAKAGDSFIMKDYHDEYIVTVLETSMENLKESRSYCWQDENWEQKEIDSVPVFSSSRNLDCHIGSVLAGEPVGVETYRINGCHVTFEISESKK